MANNPPPEIQAAAAKVQAYLDGQAPQKVSDVDFAKMSPAERLDHCRKFPQFLESGLKK